MTPCPSVVSFSDEPHSPRRRRLFRIVARLVVAHQIQSATVATPRLMPCSCPCTPRRIRNVTAGFLSSHLCSVLVHRLWISASSSSGSCASGSWPTSSSRILFLTQIQTPDLARYVPIRRIHNASTNLSIFFLVGPFPLNNFLTHVSHSLGGDVLRKI